MRGIEKNAFEETGVKCPRGVWTQGMCEEMGEVQCGWDPMQSFSWRKRK